MAAEQVSAAELHEMLQQQETPLVIDVRDRAKYDEGHVPGAVHIHLSEIEMEMANLPKDRLIVTYCGGGTSGVAAANILADNGFNARVMEGFRAWQAADLPVEKGSDVSRA